MRVPRLATSLLALSALGATLLPTSDAGALSVPTATALSLPKPNYGLDEGYLPFQSCSSVGNCVLTGIYLAAHQYPTGVIEDEVKGVWTSPLSVTPPAGTDGSKGVTMEGLSCATNTSCVALGQYVTSTSELPFIVTEVSGTWHAGVEIALPTNAMSSGEVSTPHSIDCVSVGNCTVVGTYTTDDATFATEGFLATQVKGVWHRAVELSLPAGANANPFVSLLQVACWSTSACVAVGSYLDANNVSHAIVVPETGGVWKRALAVGLPGNTSAFAGAMFDEVTCVATGSCVAVGTYNTVTGAVQPLVALSLSGVWNRALEVNLPNAAPNPQALVFGFKGVACASAGNCALGGQYIDKSGHYQGFLDNIANGFVQRAQTLALPGGAVQAGRNGGAVSVSCPAVGTCLMGAAFLSATNKYEGLLVGEVADVWAPGKVIALPGTATTVGTGGGVYSTQCFTTTACQVSGSYQSSATRYDGFALVTGA